MSPQATVRAQARGALQHNYPTAIFALVTALLPVMLLNTVSGAVLNLFYVLGGSSKSSSILEITLVYPLMMIGGVLLSPFFNGYVRVYYRNGFTGVMEPGDLYYYFEGANRYTAALALNLSFLLRMLLPAALCFAPVIGYLVICVNMDNGFYGSVLFGGGYFILWILSSILLTLYGLRYFTVFTLHVENEALCPRELFRLTREIMREQTGSAAKLIFSYTPWMLLCLTVLPMLYVVPYMTQGLCIGAKWMTRAKFEEHS